MESGKYGPLSVHTLLDKLIAAPFPINKKLMECLNSDGFSNQKSGFIFSFPRTVCYILTIPAILEGSGLGNKNCVEQINCRHFFI